MRKPPELIIQSLQAAGEGSPSNIISALKDHGYHLVSDVEVEARDNPPISDAEVKAEARWLRYGEEPAYREWKASLTIDGVKIYGAARAPRWQLEMMNDADGFVAHTRRRLVMEAMSHLSEFLGGGSFV